MMIRSIVMLVTMLVMALPAYAQDTINFPEPTGEYEVGVTWYPLVDESREEIFTEDTGDKREVLVTVYYPAQPAAEAVTAPYAEGILRDSLGIPTELVDRIQTQVYASVPVADGSFPVLIFSPGMFALPLTYSSLLTEVASHGYVVAAIWHPYSTGVTVFPDGRALAVNAEGFVDPYADPVASEEAGNHIGAVWVGDAMFVVDQLEQFNTDDALLAGHLDLGHLGAFGHSFGGGMAAAVHSLDSRFKAGINMDGPLFGNVEEAALAQPFMAMESTDWDLSISDEQLTQIGLTREEYEASINGFISSYTGQLDNLVNNAAVGYSARLTGATHFTFVTDLMLVAPMIPEVLPDTAVGDLAGERGVEVIGAYVRAFFDQHLKGENESLLSSESADYPEVEFEVVS